MEAKRQISEVDDFENNGLHYPPEKSNTFADVLYQIRGQCDQQLAKVIDISSQNKELRRMIEGYKGNLPGFLLKWWLSNGEVGKLMAFLQTFEESIRGYIEDMEEKMQSYRGEREVMEADYEEELRISRELAGEVKVLEKRLTELKQRNVLNRSQLQNTRGAIPELHNEYKNMRQYQQRLNQEYERRQLEKELIDVAMRDQVSANPQQNYDKQQEMLICHLLGEKKEVVRKLDQMKDKIQQLEREIQFQKSEKMEKERIKVSIIDQSEEIAQLKKELVAARAARQQAEKLKKKMQDDLSEQLTQKAIQNCDLLKRQYKGMALRLVQLAKGTVERAKIEEIEKILNNNQL